MPISFSRYKPLTQRTFALRAFNDHESEINRHYWSFKVISDYSGFIARTEAEVHPAKRTAEVFSASGPDSKRIPATVTDWIKARGELENWLRVGALVSASAYLELYLRQSLRSALMSDPFLRFGKSRSVDGVTLLKNGIEIPIDNELKLLTTGDWPTRSRRFDKMFGGIPALLDAGRIKALERIRRLRNSHAHGFGRALTAASPLQLVQNVTARVSADQLVRDLGTVSKVAASIDKFLLEKFIGNFELIYFYHEWQYKPRLTTEKSFPKERAFKAALGTGTKIYAGLAFCRDLITFYDNI
jgi:hypothetical protein